MRRSCPQESRHGNRLGTPEGPGFPSSSGRLDYVAALNNLLVHNSIARRLLIQSSSGDVLAQNMCVMTFQKRVKLLKGGAWALRQFIIPY